MSEINYKERARQLVDFGSLKFGNGFMATDIDIHIEWDSTCHVFCEMKYNDAKVSKGQELAMTRLVDDISKPTLLVVAEHDVANPHDDITPAKAKIRAYYSNMDNPRQWIIPRTKMTFAQIANEFLMTFGGQRYRDLANKIK